MELQRTKGGLDPRDAALADLPDHSTPRRCVIRQRIESPTLPIRCVVIPCIRDVDQLAQVAANLAQWFRLAFWRIRDLLEVREDVPVGPPRWHRGTRRRDVRERLLALLAPHELQGLAHRKTGGFQNTNSLDDARPQRSMSHRSHMTMPSTFIIGIVFQLYREPAHRHGGGVVNVRRRLHQRTWCGERVAARRTRDSRTASTQSRAEQRKECRIPIHEKPTPQPVATAQRIAQAAEMSAVNAAIIRR